LLDRKLSDYEYNVEALDHCPWGKAFQLMNSLKGGDPDEEAFFKVLRVYCVKRNWEPSVQKASKRLCRPE
jgi:hypothetical protein